MVTPGFQNKGEHLSYRKFKPGRFITFYQVIKVCGSPKFIGSKTEDAIKKELTQETINFPAGLKEKACTEMRRKL
jgi:hypothetical protein